MVLVGHPALRLVLDAGQTDPLDGGAGVEDALSGGEECEGLTGVILACLTFCLRVSRDYPLCIQYSNFTLQESKSSPDL